MRIAAGAVGISPCRKARGPVGIRGFALPLTSSILKAGDATPFNLCLGLREPGTFSFRLATFGLAEATLSDFRRRSFSTSFARLSNANFSLCDLLKNLGYF